MNLSILITLKKYWILFSRLSNNNKIIVCVTGFQLHKTFLEISNICSPV